MALPITNEDYRVVRQNIRNEHVRIDLLNFRMQVVDNLEGRATGGSYTINADSDIRRTCTINMVVTDSSFNVETGGKIWLDKYIQVYKGIDNLVTGEINWINLGIYLINNPTRTYDPETNTLSFQALDLMSKLTGARNGYIQGAPTIIPAGESIRETMISTLTQLGGFTKYVIWDNPQLTPYEIKVERAATVFDILKQLRDITPNCEIFFDINGVFHYQQIPSGAGDPVLVDNNVWNSVTTQVEVNTAFDEVKNVIEVWGHSHDPSVNVVDITVSGNTYTGTSTGLAALTENIVVSFVPPSVVANPSIKINDFAALPILNADGSAAVIPIADGTMYCLQVNPGGTSFLFLGKQQIYATISETNTDSPFYIGGSTGQIRYICTGGEYENIWTDDLALQRAEYELYLHARVIDSITLVGVPVDWLDVNIKIEYLNDDLGLTNQKWNSITNSYDLPSHFIIKSITSGLGHEGAMTITASRFYPLYPFS